MTCSRHVSAMHGPWTKERLEACLDGAPEVASALAERCPAETYGLTEAALVSRLRDLIPDHAKWAELDLDGLVLASGCLRDVAPALARLEREVLAPVVRTICRRSPGLTPDELGQALRERLLVGRPPKLALFSGRGSLEAFVRIVSANLASNLRQPTRDLAEVEALEFVADRLDLASAVARIDQQTHFRACFRRAVALLDIRQRTLLRLNLLEGVSIDELAPMYGAHRSTVARWMSEARAVLGSNVKRLLAEQLGLDADEVERLLTSVQDGFELSLSSALRESVEAPAEDSNRLP